MLRPGKKGNGLAPPILFRVTVGITFLFGKAGRGDPIKVHAPLTQLVASASTLNAVRSGLLEPMSDAGTPGARAAGLRKSRLPRGGCPHRPGRPTTRRPSPDPGRSPPTAPHRPRPPPPPRPSAPSLALRRDIPPLGHGHRTGPDSAHGARGTASAASRPPRRATASLRPHRGTEKADRARDGGSPNRGRDRAIHGGDRVRNWAETGVPRPSRDPAEAMQPAHGATGCPEDGPEASNVRFRRP